MSVQAGDNAEIGAAAVKLPGFWTSCPEAWFAQAEAQFNTKKISGDTTKYEYVVIALPPDVITSILDIIKNPPVENKYLNLKNTLIRRFTDSEEKRLEELLCKSNMGDRKPSEFYNMMEMLAGTSSIFGRDLLKKLWLRKLPYEINSALVTSGKEDIGELIELADRLFEMLNQKNIKSIYNVEATNQTNNFENVFLVNKVNNLEKQLVQIQESLNNLKIQIDLQMKYNSNYFTRGRSPNRKLYDGEQNYSRWDSKRRSSSRNKTYGICWYHFKFGDKATKCIAPCKFNNSISKNE